MNEFSFFLEESGLSRYNLHSVELTLLVYSSKTLDIHQ